MGEKPEIVSGAYLSLFDPDLPDDETSKVNICVRNVLDIHKQGTEQKLTQLIFCDFSTPNKDKFNLYDDIKKKLIDSGVRENEIAFIHDAKTDKQKEALFENVRQGNIRILMGSTSKMGSGTNVQDKLVALHDLDAPWRPADLQQRSGRIVRQGNTNPEVNIYRYVTEKTFDSYLFQTLENKQKFISQVMTSKKNTSRTCEDVDESVLSYAEIKALCTGNPLIKERMDLELQVKNLRTLKTEHNKGIYALERQLNSTLPQKISESSEKVVQYELDLKQVEASRQPADHFSISLRGQPCAEKDKAGAAILDICKHKKVSLTNSNDEKIGEYRGFQVILTYSLIEREFGIRLKGNSSYYTAIGESPLGNITRINNLLEGVGQRLDSEREKLSSLNKQVIDAKAEIVKPFAKEQELLSKIERIAELDHILRLDKKGEENDLISNPLEVEPELESGDDIEQESEQEVEQEVEKPQNFLPPMFELDVPEPVEISEELREAIKREEQEQKEVEISPLKKSKIEIISVGR